MNDVLCPCCDRHTYTDQLCTCPEHTCYGCHWENHQ